MRLAPVISRLHLSRYISDLSLRFILVFYCICTIIYLILYRMFGFQYFLPNSYGVARELFVSLGGNLLFFGLFGIAALIPSLRKPSDDPIERRIDYLITSDSVSDVAKQYMTETIQRLCAYAPSDMVTLIIREIDVENSSMRIERRGDTQIRNVFKDEPYSDPAYSFIAAPDDIKKSVEIYGEITLAEINDGIMSRSIIQTPMILLSYNEFRHDEKLAIKANSTIGVRHYFWIWCNSKLPFFIFTNRYSENYSINLLNISGSDIYVSNLFEESVGLIEIKNKESVLLGKRALHPGKYDAFVLQT